MLFAQPLDVEQIQHLQGKVVTLTARFLTGANWSAPNISLSLITGTGAPAKWTGTAYAGQVVVASQTFATTASQGLTTITVTSSASVPTNATQGQVHLQWSPVGTAGAQDSIQIGNVQLEAGSQFTGFDYRPASIEWQMCQRFYCKSFDPGTQPAQNAGIPGSYLVAQVIGPAAAQQLGMVILPSRMRAGPTVTLYNPSAATAQIRNLTRGTDWTASSANAVASGSFSLVGTTPAGSAAGDQALVHWTAEAEI